MGPLSFGLTGSSSSARSGGDDEKSFGKVLLVRIDVRLGSRFDILKSPEMMIFFCLKYAQF